jgi:decaprenyl-phosphate phosphoribosyltransferase
VVHNLPPHAPDQTPEVGGHLAILRADHWVKNVFVLPGVVVALAFNPGASLSELLPGLLLGFTAICLVASSYYTLNEVLDAPFDRGHPTKYLRPVPSGRVHVPLAYVQWLALGALGVGIAWYVHPRLGCTLLALWMMGCVYNIPPIRTKDIPYVDVLSEAINNPLRLLAGWYIVNPGPLPPASLLLSYWFVGAYFMGIKRFAEFREIGNQAVAAAYRRSFAHYTERRLLTSILFYGSAAMLFFGAFTIRYRLEVILAYPFVAWIMAAYFDIAFEENSAAQAPEKLHQQHSLMFAVLTGALVTGALCFVDLPWLHTFVSPTLPTQRSPP